MVFSAKKTIIESIHSLWNTHIYSRNIRYRSFTCWEIIWNIKKMLKLAPSGRKSKTFNDLILVSMLWRHSMSWAHNSLEMSSPQRAPTAETAAEPAAPFGHCPTYTKIIKSRLSSRSVENLWINKIFDFSRIFFGLTLNHVILQNMNMVSQATYLTIRCSTYWTRNPGSTYCQLGSCKSYLMSSINHFWDEKTIGSN